MSSFDGRANIYLFDLKNGKKKLAYGTTPEDALETLAMRLTPEEMAGIIRDQCRMVRQWELRELVSQLG